MFSSHLIAISLAVIVGIGSRRGCLLLHDLYNYRGDLEITMESVMVQVSTLSTKSCCLNYTEISYNLKRSVTTWLEETHMLCDQSELCIKSKFGLRYRGSLTRDTVLPGNKEQIVPSTDVSPCWLFSQTPPSDGCTPPFGQTHFLS